MELPTEILAQIVASGLDSFATAKSWCEISPYFKSQVTKNLGIVVVTDLSSPNSEDTLDPLNYNIMSSDLNTVFTNSDQFDAIGVKTFASGYGSILIVIVSDRAFSDPLLTTLTQLTEDLANCAKHTPKNICVLYKTTCNYISKMYFRQFFLSKRLLRLCELHVLGNKNWNETDMCDLDMIFELTYLHDIQTLYSLNIRTMSDKIIAPCLRAIRQLEVTPSIKLDHYLSNCPRILQIEQFKLPSGLGKEPYVLPKCESLTLVNFNPDVRHLKVDGTNVSKELIIMTSQKIEGSTFSNLNFPNITKLKVELPLLTMGEITFSNCLFPQLVYYDCSPSLTLTNWESLVSTGADIDMLKMSISNHRDLWSLKKCPFTVTKKLTITSARPEEVTALLIDDMDLDTDQPGWSNAISFCDRVKLSLRSLWDCIIFQNLILPRISSQCSLCIGINTPGVYQSFSKLYQKEGPDVTELLARWNMHFFNNTFHFYFPSLKTLTLHELADSSSEIIFDMTEKFPSCDVPNQYTDPLVSDPYVTNLAISPSEFRRNSLAGIDSVTARRNSVLKIGGNPSSYYLRKRSSGSYSLGQRPDISKSLLLTRSEDASLASQNFFQFALGDPDNVPETITTTLDILENCLDLRESKAQIQRLEIFLTNINCKDLSIAQILADIYERVIDILHHPILKPSGKFLCKEVDMQLPLVTNNDINFETLLRDLQNFLITKGLVNIQSFRVHESYCNTVLLLRSRVCE
ncbi:LAFE_0H08372g1_1 [Lachancea fermentati]|uniref:LAFE_0H08372g1_1 n=1 Tax=Lachancea fermentati TaxID=4955 RepID=A0A1G4MJZ5_LACFM|nr:LAFE_0H08372g1_1 [Lachancea fermentati]